MADVFVTTGSNADFLVQTALDLKTRMYLPQMVIFRNFVDSRPINPAHEGPAVTFKIHGELSEAVTPLAEVTDVEVRDIPAERSVTVTMNEYGDAQATSFKVRMDDWSRELATGTIPYQLADSMARTHDTLVRGKLDASTNVWYVDNAAGNPLVTAEPADGELGGLTANAISSAVSALRTRRAVPRDGQKFIGVIHPLVSHDVRREAGPNTWEVPHNYVNTAEIYNGEIGSYAGARIVESDRCQVEATQGTGEETHFTCYFLGREALIEAAKKEPAPVVGPVVDRLKRTQYVGWHSYIGWSIFRNNAIQLVKVESTLAVEGAELVDVTAVDPKA